MQSIEQPAVLNMPFANNGDKSTLPTSPSGTNKASLSEGFPQITSQPITSGGIPPSREDFNALGYISTMFGYMMQCGGAFTYSDSVATAIGGYPLNALLWYFPVNGEPLLLRSTIVNNTNNFINDNSYIGAPGSGKPWEIANSSGDVIDNLSITKNTSNELQTTGIINQNSQTSALKIWSGSKAQYDDISNKDANTLYYVDDDSSNILDILNTLLQQTQQQVSQIIDSIYPVGSLYITTSNSNPATLLGLGTWTKIGDGRVLQNADSNHAAGTTIEAGLPNITGEIAQLPTTYSGFTGGTGALVTSSVAGAGYSGNANGGKFKLNLDASESNEIYGNSTTVQPPAYVVNIWERIS